MHYKKGFTIVELLIVIVVIAILATISIVAYNGIQQRAHNAQTVTAAKEILKLLQLYKADNGDYPSGGYAYACVGEYEDDVCQEFNTGVDEVNEQANFKAAIATVGTMPQPYVRIHDIGSGRRAGGVLYRVAAKNVSYWLEGEGQQCLDGANGGSWSGRTYCTSVLQ